jgi:hypothetical protein
VYEKRLEKVHQDAGGRITAEGEGGDVHVCCLLVLLLCVLCLGRRPSLRGRFLFACLCGCRVFRHDCAWPKTWHATITTPFLRPCVLSPSCLVIFWWLFALVV